ncbi:MAG TPA: hypothetical protein VEB21_01775 [Terriglobales bacterium]|nr:hypothetical protein [Terriglobales bacterium]
MAFSDALLRLLEGKHIYQSIVVDPAPILQRFEGRLSESDQWAMAAKGGTGVDRIMLVLSDGPLRTASKDGQTAAVPTLAVQNVKLFCDQCDEREVFAPLWMRELNNETTRVVSHPYSSHAPTPVPGNQLFAIALRCQRCHGALSAVIVRRTNWKLTLEGRSPMEHIGIPKFIPKTEGHLYRDALIAVHGGKVLGGLFYLRSFIEQFARRQTGLRGKETGETIMASYARTLPAERRDSMPSLADWYDRLSAALHEAKEDMALFDSAIEAIENHFDIRRVFKIPDARPPVSAV